LNGLNPLGEEARRISVLPAQLALALGKARMNVVSNVFRHHAFADDLLDLSLDVAIAARRLQRILQSRTPHSVVADLMPGKRQLVAKLSLAFGSETHLCPKLRFAGKIARRIVFFSFEIVQGDDFCRLRQVIFGDHLFLMNGFLQRSPLG